MAEPAQSPRILYFGTFEFDRRTGELRKHGIKIRVLGQPVDILGMLLDCPGEMVTREELRAKLWPGNRFVDFEHSLNAAVNKLREALGDSADNPRFVETLPRRGYRFIAEVDGFATPMPLNGPPRATTDSFARRAISPLVEGAEAGLSKTRWRLRVLLAAIVAVALAAAAVGLNVRGWRDRLQGRAAQPRIRSIAVLPLESLSGNPEQEYFADGMTDELITNLAQISALRVISRGSVMQYKAKRVPAPQIARELNVDALVEGTVSRSGDRMRITAQLIDARTDRHLWAQTYERDLRDVLALQDEVAQAIAKQVEINLTPQEQMLLATHRPVNPEAYDSYLKGRYYWNRRTSEAVKKALDYMNQAIAKDPTYALAYAGLADCYIILAHKGDMVGEEAQPKARAAAQRALELDPLLPEAHTALAAVRETYDFDWAGAETEFKRALELNPNYANAHHWYGLMLMNLGRLDEARQQIELARGLDLLSLQIQLNVGAVDERARQFDKAMEVYRKVAEMDPTFVGAHVALSQAYRRKEMYREAATELQKALLLINESKEAALFANVMDAAGYRRAIAQQIALRKERSKTRYVSSMWFADRFLELQDNEKALAWLEKAFRERDEPVVYLKMDPFYDPLRSDPRFQGLLRRIGLPPSPHPR